MITVAAKMALITMIGNMITHIDTFGTVPSAINNAHGLASQEADKTPEPFRSAILLQIALAEKANQTIGATKNPDGSVKDKGMLLTLRDDLGVLAEAIRNLPTEEAAPPPAPPSQPPVVIPEGGLVGTVYRSGMGPAENPSGRLRWKAYEQNHYEVHAGSDGVFSFTAASGNVYCYVARKADMSDEVGQMGSSPDISVKPGDVLYLRFSGAASQDLTASIPRA